MTVFRFSNLDNAASGRARALRSRDAGGGTVKIVARTTGKVTDPKAGTWGRLAAETRCRWQDASAEAIEAFRFAVHGHEWAELVL